MRSFIFKLHGCDTNPDHEDKRHQVDADNVNEACEIAKANAQMRANRWHVPVEVLLDGKAIEMVFPY